MPTTLEARQFARDWIAAWNSHNLDRILSHYASNVVLSSPAAAKLLKEQSGTVTGIVGLRSYFQLGLDAFPNLRFDLIDVLVGVSSVVLLFNNQRGTQTAEFMELDPNGGVIRVVAHYSD